MSRKRFKAEQVIGMLREEDVKLSQGRSGVGLSGNGYVKAMERKI
jgi:hypothetical protein